MEEIEHITHKIAWLRTFKAGQKRTAQFNSPKDCQSLSVLLARWNWEEGRERGIRLLASYNRRLSQATVRALPFVDKTGDSYA